MKIKKKREIKMNNYNEDNFLIEKLPNVYELLKQMDEKEQKERKEAASKFKRENG